MSEEAKLFRWNQGWPGPLVCAEFAAKKMAAGCNGSLHIQEASRELRCKAHCAGPTQCSKSHEHTEVT